MESDVWIQPTAILQDYLEVVEGNSTTTARNGYAILNVSAHYHRKGGERIRDVDHLVAI